MNTYLVAVVDGAIARFLILEPLDMPEYESGPTLVELDSLSAPEGDQHGEALWATTKPGRNRGSAGQAHGYDDHREQHMVEFSRRFAQTIVQHLISLIQSYEAGSLVLVAEPKILGQLREAIAPATPKHLTVQDLAKDLCALKPRDIHDYLAKRNLIPAHRYVSPS